jgi:hypothetical protein
LLHPIRFLNTRIRVIKDTINKKPKSISGKISFHNLDNDQINYVSFDVDKSKNKLICFRQGKKLALMVLQFEVIKESTRGKMDSFFRRWISYFKEIIQTNSDTLNSQKEPLYNIEYSNIMGCKVLSTLNSMDLSRLRNQKMDFGLAKAEIPGINGKWILKGHLLLLKKERQFIARKGILCNSKGEVVKTALQIIVPIDAPEKFQVKGEKLESLLDFQYKSEWNLSRGCVLYSSRKAFNMDEFNGKKVDFKRAQAEIFTNKGKWILSGRLIWIKDGNRLLGENTTLTNPAGKVMEKNKKIVLPIKNPSKYKIFDSN